MAIEHRRRVTTSPIRAAVALGMAFVLGMVVRSIGTHDSTDGGDRRSVAVSAFGGE